MPEHLTHDQKIKLLILAQREAGERESQSFVDIYKKMVGLIKDEQKV